MQFCWTTLHVAEYERSLIFYRDIIGLPVASDTTHGGLSIAMLGPQDGPKVELLYDAGTPAGQGEGVTLGFTVENLETATKLLEDNGFPLQSGPISPGPQIRFSFFSDPDGYQVQLVENLH